MTDHASTSPLLDNEQIHCNRYPSQSETLRPVGQSHSLTDNESPRPSLNQFLTGYRQGQHSVEVDSDFWLNDSWAQSDSIINRESKDNSGGDESTDNVIRVFENNGTYGLNQRNDNGDELMSKHLPNSVGDCNNTRSHNTALKVKATHQENDDSSVVDLSTPTSVETTDVEHASPIQEKLPKKMNTLIDMQAGDTGNIHEKEPGCKELSETKSIQTHEDNDGYKTEVSKDNELKTTNTTSSTQTSTDPSSVEVEATEGAALNQRATIKKRTSSTIRRIQETIRKEQLKDVNGKNYQDLEDGTSTRARTSPAAKTLRSVRQHRSKSRTRYWKGKFDQMQRPYRRWLGVSTCVASDTRFIVEPGSNVRRAPFGDTDQESPSPDGEISPEIWDREYIQLLGEESVQKKGLNIADKATHAQSSESKNVGCQVEDDLSTGVCKSSVDQTTSPLKNSTLSKKLRFDESAMQTICMFDDSTPFVVTLPEPSSKAGCLKKHDIDKACGPCFLESSPAGDAIGDNIRRQDRRLAQEVNCEASSELDILKQKTQSNAFSGVGTKGDKSMVSELKAIGDPDRLSSKLSTGKSLKSRLGKVQDKAEYINVQAVQDYQGSLPGQLSFRQGQVIKQLNKGLHPPDGMHYGYYRAGRLSRKVWGIYPSSHVTIRYDSDNSDANTRVGCNGCNSNWNEKAKVKKAKGRNV